jgi:5,10-methylene-tetrahydrofolate dehydrogenase/methenyl tetrahydrofolate cyclohydrolase
MIPIPLANHLTESELQQRIDKEKDASVKDKYRAFEEEQAAFKKTD